ncbi:hypothetical protein Slip_1823 [Syntrophothermus lipocalidus DSM 12680]|uniref:Uncharacterized protein n=2 Tax=Syntrophothermus TaxID=129001 RepID=D7CPE3_SYNLT|nr:hypothetical protein Slip_1823 [Syntrophothermus lipocalidus DSM 12680]
MSHWKHDKLCEDLAISLGGTPYLNVPLGSRFMRAYENQIKLYRAIAQAEDYQTARKNLHQVQMADVMRVLPSYTRFCVFIYEVKVSRNDFLSDIRSGKWRGYLDHCHRFMFAMPTEIATKDDIPTEAGLIVRGPKGWKIEKSAPFREIDIPKQTLMSMLFMKQRNSLRQRNLSRALYEGKHSRWSDEAKHLGKKIAKALARFDEYEFLISETKQAIAEGLGIAPDGWEIYELRELVRQIKVRAELLQITSEWGIRP